MSKNIVVLSLLLLSTQQNFTEHNNDIGEVSFEVNVNSCEDTNTKSILNSRIVSVPSHRRMDMFCIYLYVSTLFMYFNNSVLGASPLKRALKVSGSLLFLDDACRSFFLPDAERAG